MRWRNLWPRSVFNRAVLAPLFARSSAVWLAVALTACTATGLNTAPVSDAQLAAGRSLSLEQLTQRVEQRDANATLELARRYHQGEGVAQNGETALALYRTVATTETPQSLIAETRIGLIYMEGVVPVKRDLVEAYLQFDRIIARHGKYVRVDEVPVLKYHNFSRINMTDAERAALEQRLQQEHRLNFSLP